MPHQTLAVAVIWNYEVAVYPFTKMQEVFKDIPARGRYFLNIEDKEWALYRKTRGRTILLEKELIPNGGTHPEHPDCKFCVFNSSDILHLNGLITWMLKTNQNNMRAVLGIGNRLE